MVFPPKRNHAHLYMYGVKEDILPCATTSKHLTQPPTPSSAQTDRHLENISTMYIEPGGNNNTLPKNYLIDNFAAYLEPDKHLMWSSSWIIFISNTIPF